MGKVKIPYYVVRHGRGYWQPTAKMRAEGFGPLSCGVDGPDAWRIAADANDRWQSHRRGERVSVPAHAATHSDPEAMIVYPRGSIGEAFGRYRRTPEWVRKAPATRDDWWRGWRRIRPIFGDIAPHTVGLEEISAWRAHLEATVGLRETHRAMKIWRALWKVAAAMHYCEREDDPSLGVRNNAAAGRSETWSEGEVARLAKAAWRLGYRGLAAALAVMWDTQLSPGDVRALTTGQLTGSTVATARAKTGVDVTVALTDRTKRLLDAYLAELGFIPLPDQPLFRTRGFAPPPGSKGGRPRLPAAYTKNSLAVDFREVRTAVFGPREIRQMLDIRRSGAVEAIAGGANAEQLAHAMGNTLSASNQLYDTYVPASSSSLRAVADARRMGRVRLRGGQHSD